MIRIIFDDGSEMVFSSEIVKALTRTIKEKHRIGVVQTFIEFTREPFNVYMVTECPYCGSRNKEVFELTLAPNLVKCCKCGYVYVRSFSPKKDREIIELMLKGGEKEHAG